MLILILCFWYMNVNFDLCFWYMNVNFDLCFWYMNVNFDFVLLVHEC